MTKNLLYVLLGVVLASGAFLTRDAVASFNRLEYRVSYMEGYLGQLTKALQGR